MRERLYNAILRYVFRGLNKLPRITFAPPSYRKHVKLINGSGPYGQGQDFSDVLDKPFLVSMLDTVVLVRQLLMSITDGEYLFVRRIPSYGKSKYIRCRFFILNLDDVEKLKKFKEEHNV
jgi:hypothetical protein